jgi:starch phosphorylase
VIPDFFVKSMSKTFWQPDVANDGRRIAYLSMEIGLDRSIPTYSGGLGILAGDTLKSCADLKVPVIGVTLFSEKGYFFQSISDEGRQQESENQWNPSDFMTALPVEVSVQAEGREIFIRAWERIIQSQNGFQVPVYFLDSNLEKNREDDRALTSYLYGGDVRYRLMQEIILGIGGVRMLAALGYTGIQRFHMNEGHASLLILELLKRHQVKDSGSIEERYDTGAVRDQCVFTTHTPIPAGHDRFGRDLSRQVLGDYFPFEDLESCFYEDCLHTTLLALNFSTYVNGVAKKHGEVTRRMFHGFEIDSITNGVHAPTWVSKHHRTLFDNWMPGWITDPFSLRHAISITPDEVWQTHQAAKQELIELTNSQTGANLDPAHFTIGFARRATSYKRPLLIFHNLDRLLSINRDRGPIQIIFGGKAHPHDGMGKDLIHRIFEIKSQLKEQVEIAFLPNYDMDLATHLVSGVDLWLNTPMAPLEASGTSGMKAALNGVPSLSVLDGWWLEGHLENVTGWAIGTGQENSPDDVDAEDMYDKLEKLILPMYYSNRKSWIDVMKNSIALNGAFFNSHRMVYQYVLNAYLD